MKTLDEVRKLTNVDDLIRPPVVNTDPPQPTIDHVTNDEPFLMPHRTNDPVQSQFYAADMAASLSNGAPLKTPVIVMAWLFLALPAFGWWLLLVGDFVWRAGWNDIHTPRDFAAKLAAFLGATAFAAFWPYLLLRRHARKK